MELRGDRETLNRVRLTVNLSGILAVTALTYAVFYATVVGFRQGAVILGAGAAAAPVGLAVLRMRAGPRAAAHLLTAVVYGVIVALMCFEGGLTGLATSWLVTPPLFAILLAGRRGAVAWTTLSVLTVLGFHAAESRGLHFAVAYPAAWADRIAIGSYAGVVISSALLLFVFEDIRAAAQARAEEASAALARLAYHDALTGLPNRARFLECLEGALARAHAADDPSRVAVLLLDLDGFKGVNDSMGHAAGDRLLEVVAARLLNATRGCDTVARLGGDEFAVLLDGVRCDADGSVVARRIVSAIADPFVLPAGEARIGVSVGFARAVAPSSAALLHDADVALYRAKALGRGRWVRFEPGMDAAVREQATLASVRSLGPPQLGVA